MFGIQLQKVLEIGIASSQILVHWGGIAKLSISVFVNAALPVFSKNYGDGFHAVFRRKTKIGINYN